MKLTRYKGGSSIVVYQGDSTRLGDDMLLQDRCDYCVKADYSAGSEIEKTVTLLLRRIKANTDCTRLHTAQMDEALRRGATPEYILQMQQVTDLED